MTTYREVIVSWRDEPDNYFAATVAVDDEWNPVDDEDDGVFFWFASEFDYQECLLNGEADFTMEEARDE